MYVCGGTIGFDCSECPFYSTSEPSADHSCPHSYFECSQKPIEERTFTRKDHLKQHILRVHLKQRPLFVHQKWDSNVIEGLDNLLDGWHQVSLLDPGDPELHCGFCGMWFDEWKTQVNHVEDHFKEDLDLSCWWPERKYIRFIRLFVGAGNNCKLSASSQKLLMACCRPKAY